MQRKKTIIKKHIFPRRLIIVCVLLFNAAVNLTLYTLSTKANNKQSAQTLSYTLVLAQTQTGKASFYAKRATGSRTANGERLHHDSMTCAHRTLPFGTFLRVTNLSNGQNVVVRVNDRGPFVRGRIIDLSWGAAKEIGMIAQGIAQVTVELADGITIPLRARTEKIVFPKIEIDSIELAGSMKPIWQEDLLIDHEEMNRQMKRTNQKVIRHKIATF